MVTGSKMLLTGGALSENIWWMVGSTVNLEAMVTFKGSILSASTITLGSGTAVNGGLYSSSTITLADNKVGLVVPS